MDTLNGVVLELNGDTAETSQPILNTPNLQQKKRWMNTLCEKHILNGPHAQLVRSVWTKKNETERKASAQDEKQRKKLYSTPFLVRLVFYVNTGLAYVTICYYFQQWFYLARKMEI